MEVILPSAPFTCDACRREMPAAFVVTRPNKLGFSLQLCADCDAEMTRRYGPALIQCQRCGISAAAAQMVARPVLNAQILRLCSACDVELNAAAPSIPGS